MMAATVPTTKTAMSLVMTLLMRTKPAKTRPKRRQILPKVEPQAVSAARVAVVVAVVVVAMERKKWSLTKMRRAKATARLTSMARPVTKGLAKRVVMPVAKPGTTQTLLRAVRYVGVTQLRRTV